jgi:hypothetical protein
MTDTVLPFRDNKPVQPAAQPGQTSAELSATNFLWTVPPKLVAEFGPAPGGAPACRLTVAEHAAEARRSIALEIARHAPTMQSTAPLIEALLATSDVRAVLAGFGADANTPLVRALERELAPEWQ